MGIRHFCKLIENMDRKRSFTINMDSIGSKFTFYSNNISPRKKPDLYKIVLDKGRELGLELKYKF